MSKERQRIGIYNYSETVVEFELIWKGYDNNLELYSMAEIAALQGISVET